MPTDRMLEISCRSTRPYPAACVGAMVGHVKAPLDEEDGVNRGQALGYFVFGKYTAAVLQSLLTRCVGCSTTVLLFEKGVERDGGGLVGMGEGDLSDHNL